MTDWRPGNQMMANYNQLFDVDIITYPYHDPDTSLAGYSPVLSSLFYILVI